MSVVLHTDDLMHADRAGLWRLCLQQNCIKWGSGGLFKFKRQWSAHCLDILLRSAKLNLPVTAQQLQNHLQVYGQSTALNRAQCLRIIKEIQRFALSEQHKLAPIAITHAPRKASVGPWRLKHLYAAEWTVMEDAVSHVGDWTQQHWPWPRLMDARVLSVHALLQCLGGWLTIEGLAIYSNIKPALGSLVELTQMQISTEARTMLSLREMQLLRQIGDWPAVIAIAERLLADPASHLEHRAYSYARFMLERVSYDRQPATIWPALLKDPQPPKALLIACPSTLAEWHNLQALMLRRAILECESGAAATAMLLHQKALLHIESAMYQALSFQHWDRLHAYIDNLAYYLQKVEPLGLCSIEDVHDAYAIALVCADKLDSGHDDATDLIFYAEFWLDRASKLSANYHHRSAFFDDQLHPRHFAFWQHMLERTQSIGSPVQHGMALALSIRWGRLNAQLLPLLWLVGVEQQLSALLNANTGLSQRLSEDDYAN